MKDVIDELKLELFTILLKHRRFFLSFGVSLCFLILHIYMWRFYGIVSIRNKDVGNIEHCNFSRMHRKLSKTECIHKHVLHSLHKLKDQAYVIFQTFL